MEAREVRGQAAGFAPVPLGRCPVCGSEVVEQPKFYGCSAWRDGRRFAIAKTIAAQRIGVRAAQALLCEDRSPVLKGFTSRAGRRFEARPKWYGGAVRFDFGP
jgi:DNA topoisomerase-3